MPSQLAVAEMLRCGVTCYNDMYFFPHVSARVTSEYVHPPHRQFAYNFRTVGRTTPRTS
jgi:hypothetical protein